MVSDCYWRGNPDANKDDHLRTAWGVIPSIEFYPFKKVNLYFYAAYVARTYKYTDYAKTTFGSGDYDTSRLMIGFISPLLIL
jgi:hypothetical protein